MNKIVKIIFDDGEVIKAENISPIVISEDKKEQWKNNRMYERQFGKFERIILENLDQSVVEDYAEDNFDLVNEDNVENKTIDDFDDEEIMEEVRARKLLGNNNNIISEQFISRFSKIIEKENQILLDNLLTDLESKLNI